MEVHSASCCNRGPYLTRIARRPESISEFVFHSDTEASATEASTRHSPRRNPDFLQHTGQRTLELRVTNMVFLAGDPFHLLVSSPSYVAMSNVTALAGIRSSGFEIKFVLDVPVASDIVEWARTHMERDPHGSGNLGDEYLITNL
jgi:hypothetical protein